MMSRASIWARLSWNKSTLWSETGSTQQVRSSCTRQLPITPAHDEIRNLDPGLIKCQPQRSPLKHTVSRAWYYTGTNTSRGRIPHEEQTNPPGMWSFGEHCCTLLSGVLTVAKLSAWYNKLQYSTVRDSHSHAAGWRLSALRKG